LLCAQQSGQCHESQCSGLASRLSESLFLFGGTDPHHTRYRVGSHLPTFGTCGQSKATRGTVHDRLSNSACHTGYRGDLLSFDGDLELNDHVSTLQSPSRALGKQSWSAQTRSRLSHGCCLHRKNAHEHVRVCRGLKQREVFHARDEKPVLQG
jgi:hypothetical protein